MPSRSTRLLFRCSSALLAAAFAPSAIAQERVPIDIEPIVSSLPAIESEPIDLRAGEPTRGARTAEEIQECEDRLEASEISGEIVVCAKRRDNGADRFAGSHQAWLNDYAERTQNYNAPAAPNVDGSGLPFGLLPIVEVRGCFIPPCPKDPALLIGVEAVPPPPGGSDADRIARGLPPLGQDEDLTEEEIRKRREKLGLPPPAFEKKN